jgi:type II secretory pathway component PulK
MVLIIGLLLSASTFTFLRRSMVDTMLIRNLDNSAAATALARGGAAVGTAVVFHHRLSKIFGRLNDRHAGALLSDPSALIGDSELRTSWGGILRIRIEDAGSRLNLNALVPMGQTEEESQASREAEDFLVEVLKKVGEELQEQGRGRNYEVREMARNLIDFMDQDDVAIGGHDEDEYYANQIPPYQPTNGPMLSVEELAMVQGFDSEIAEALKPYVTVYPLLGEEGINVNTAPPHVLSLLYHGSSGDMRLADEDIVRNILEQRREDRILCTETESDPDRCITLSEVGLGEGSIFPATTLPAEALVFRVIAEARVEEAIRTVETVVDISNQEEPRLLLWRVR